MTNEAIFDGDPVFIAKAEEKVYQGGIVNLTGRKPLSGYYFMPYPPAIAHDSKLYDMEGNAFEVASVSAGVAMNTADVGEDVIVHRCWAHPQPVYAVQL